METDSLRRVSLIALAVAVVITVTVVLPAEYAVDPTGIGQRIGLRQMGRLKLQLAKEAAEDARADALAMLAADSAKARAPNPALSHGPFYSALMRAIGLEPRWVAPPAP